MGNVLHIQSDQRTIVIGKTGSGKSYFCRYLIRPLPRLIVCDSKEVVRNDQWGLVDYTRAKFNKMVRNPEAPGRLRLRVEGRDKGRAWADHFHSFLSLRNCLIDIDELNQVGSAVTGDELRSLFTRGRELGIGVMACTQRPAWVPRESMTEAEHYVIFQVKADDDEKRIYEFVGNAGYRELARYNKEGFVDLEKYQFLYYSEEDNYAKLYDRLNVKGVTNGS